MKHVMIIPDGDRRYAVKKGIKTIDAYRKAAIVVKNLVDWILVKNNISEFTFFGLSYSNVIKRTKIDLEPILEIQTKALNEFAEDEIFHSNGIKVITNGEKHLLPRNYQNAISNVEKATQTYTNKKFNLLLGYSGKLDFERALKKTLSQKKTSTFEDIQKNSSVPTPIDFLIRTAGEKRVSDGPLFALQHTEFCFIDKLFPELTKKDIDKALKSYKPEKINLRKAI